MVMFINNFVTKKPKEKLKKFIIFFYVYMILEGMLRKWFVPILNKEIYFLKDFFLIFIYFYAFKHKFLFEKKISKIITLFIVISLFFGVIGYNFNKIDILSFILGSRSYFLFVPLFFVIIHIFSIQDVKKFCEINLYFVLPYFILVLFQAISPNNSFINSGYNSLVQTPERPSAYFTYITQNTYYFLFLLCSCFSYFLSKCSIGKKDLFLSAILIFFLTGIMILLKSRAVYVYSSAVAIYSIYIALFANQNFFLKLKKLLIPLVLFPIFFNINSHIFEKEYNFSMVRFNTDHYQSLGIVTEYKEIKIENKLLIKLFGISENDKNFGVTINDFCNKNSSICRVINELYFISSLNSSSLFGEGLGAGTSVVAHIKKDQKFSLGEAENHRIIGELGYLFGTVFVLLKYFFVIFINLQLVFNRKIKNKLFLFPFLVFVSVAFLISPITYTTSFISFICWFVLGIVFLAFDKKNISKF
jgi:hypothetical protein